jgi:hypothetical protein
MQTNQLEAIGSLLKLKGGSSGTQILDSNNNLLLESSTGGLSSLKNFNVINGVDHPTISIINTRAGEGIATLGLSSAGNAEGRIYVGWGKMSVATLTNHRIEFKTNYPINPVSLIIEADGDVVCHTNMKAQGGFETDQVQTTSSLLKLKGGVSGTQILDETDGLLLEASSVGVSMLQNVTVLKGGFEAIVNATNTSGSGYASLYTVAGGVTGQMYTGGNVMSISTNSNHPIRIATNRFNNPTSLTIENNGAVVCNTSFTNNSDTRLKDNQQSADLDEIQTVFDAVEVKTYERNDLSGQKRVGFIAQEFEAVLPEVFKHIVGDGTLKRSEESDEEVIKTLDYSRLTTILWGVCKRLQNRLDVLEARV